MEKTIVCTTREFRANQKEYLDMVDNGNEVILTRQNRAYKITKVGGFYSEGLLLGQFSKMMHLMKDELKADILKEIKEGDYGK